MKLSRWGIIVPIVIFLIVMVLGIFNIGLTMTTSMVEQLQSTDVFLAVDYDQQGNRICPVTGNKSNVLLKRIIYKNDFIIPREMEIPDHYVCFAPGNEYMYADIRYLVDGYYPETSEFLNQRTFVLPAHSQRTVEIRMVPICPTAWGPFKGPAPTVQNGEEMNIKELLMIESKDQEYVDCTRLTKRQSQEAQRIPIV